MYVNIPYFRGSKKTLPERIYEHIFLRLETFLFDLLLFLCLICLFLFRIYSIIMQNLKIYGLACFAHYFLPGLHGNEYHCVNKHSW